MNSYIHFLIRSARHRDFLRFIVTSLVLGHGYIMWVRPFTAAKYRLQSFLTCVNVCFAATMLITGDVHFLLPLGLP